MLVSALVDPAAFDESHFRDRHYGSWAKQFFKEMTTENGLLLADRNAKHLIRGLRNRFHTLNEKDRQYLLLYLTEAIKQKRFLFGDCSDADMMNICCELIRHYNPDAVIASPENINRFRSLRDNADPATVLSFHEYQDSSFQEARCRYLHKHQDLAKMEDQERENIFLRVTQFSSYLRIYDKQIGNSSTSKDKGKREGIEQYKKRLVGFQKGIKFVLNQWPHCRNKKKGRFEIFTSARHIEGNQFECRQDLMMKDFLEPLRRRHRNIQFVLFVKKDINRYMHARYLQTRNAVLSVERGFDFYDREGNFKWNPISLVMGQEIVDTLRSFRGLKDVYHYPHNLKN